MRDLKREILTLLKQRNADATMCPSEVPRRLHGDRWREYMEATRQAAFELRDEGIIEICQKGEPVAADTVIRGPIRLRIRESLSVGIDVQVRRPCAVAVMNQDREVVWSEWISGNAGAVVENLVERLGKESNVVLGIDAPRRPLLKPRPLYWNRKKRIWRKRTASDCGRGRHCEVVVRSAGLANPQWTPVAEDAPEWMRLGFDLFSGLESAGFVCHEVFPSAAYSQLKDAAQIPVSLDFKNFAGGPKDMLDACVAALTVHEFRAGRGVEVGADGLGGIVLPRPLPEGTPPELLRWPG